MKDDCRTRAPLTGSLHVGDETMEGRNMKVECVLKLECGIDLSDDAAPLSQNTPSYLDTSSHWRLVKFPNTTSIALTHHFANVDWSSRE